MHVVAHAGNAGLGEGEARTLVGGAGVGDGPDTDWWRSGLPVQPASAQTSASTETAILLRITTQDDAPAI
jgi:hypothetical protein